MSEKDEKIDKLLEELEAEKAAKDREEESLSDALKADEQAVARAKEERRSKVSGFRLDLDADAAFAEHNAPPQEPAGGETEEAASAPADEPAEGEAQPAADGEEPTASPEEENAPEEGAPGGGEEPEAPGKKKKKKNRGAWGCIRGILYAVLVLGISGVLAYFGITGGMDLVGLGKSSRLVDVEIPQGASTVQIAAILKENGIIDQPLVFRLYSKVTKADGTYQPGTFALSADMGYSGIIDELQNAKPRESITVTIPEGKTVEEIAAILEEKKVCSSTEFYQAVLDVDAYDYDFLKEIPDASQGEEYAGRIYTLEGYLFPDTYEFFENSSGKTVITKFLDNFDRRVDVKMRTAFKAKGLTLDQAVNIASIIQGEAAKKEDMLKVSRVLYNRLENPAEYPYLQCDSTGDYIRKIYSQADGAEVVSTAYDTYERKGLPVGPINNPGLDALEAALNPSDDPEAADCYFFATDYDTGITYFSKTYAEHERICKRYGIGMYG